MTDKFAVPQWLSRWFRKPAPVEPAGTFGGAGATESWQPDPYPPITRAPLGLRLNNPGNVRPLPGGRLWRGQVSVEKGFAVFATADEGLRAMALNLRNYQRFHAINTVEKIVTRYAPAADNNNVTAYITSVRYQTGWAEWQPLDLQDRRTLATLVRAMIRHEQGVQPFPEAVILAAVDSALEAV